MGTKYLNTANGQIAYDEVGEGPLVLCVPSMGDLRGEYRFLAPRLADAGYRVVTMDVRGHGESSVEWSDYTVAAIGADMLALIRHLNAGPALLVGTSMAAGASVWAAAEAEDLIAGLVLIGPFVRDMGPIWLGKLIITPLIGGPWGVALWGKYYSMLYPSRKPEDFEAYTRALQSNLRQPGRKQALQRMLLASKRASEERLGEVSAPALVIMGSRDPDFKDPGAEAKRVAEWLNGTAHMVEGAGHYPHAEMPEMIEPLIVGFARSAFVEKVDVATSGA
ncbi:MAG TPA: alpha/beta hydrolase [Anaerolineales bacterium]